MFYTYRHSLTYLQISNRIIYLLLQPFRRKKNLNSENLTVLKSENKLLFHNFWSRRERNFQDFVAKQTSL